MKKHSWTNLSKQRAHETKTSFLLSSGAIIRECEECGIKMSEFDFKVLGKLFRIMNCNEVLANKVLDE